MNQAVENVIDLAIADDSEAKAANAIYDEIEIWCANQRRWQTRLWNWMRPWHHELAPHLPMRPLYWRVLVMIREPEEITPGGIILTKALRDVEAHLTYVGMVVAIGKLAYKAVARNQLKLKHERNPKLGDKVVFYKHAGTRFRTLDGLHFVLITETEMWGETDEPERLDTLAI